LLQVLGQLSLSLKFHTQGQRLT